MSTISKINEMIGAENRFVLAVFLVSGALLAYEILAIRFISILLFPVAAYLLISLALLGLGLGGIVLALRRSERYLSPNMAALGAMFFALTLLLVLVNMWFAERLPNPLLFILVTLAIPFAFGGWTIAVSLAIPGFSINRIYFADLLGAGASSLFVFFGLIAFDAPKILLFLSALGFLALVMFSQNTRLCIIGFILTLSLLLSVLLIEFPPGILPISPKELALVNRFVPDFTWEYQGWNPIARIDVLSIPGRCSEIPGEPACKLVTQDGGAPSILLEPIDRQAQTDFIRNTIFGMPYWIKNNPEVLVIGLGGAPDVQAALMAGAKHITGVEINRKMVEIVEERFASFVGKPYQDPRVTLVIGDGRNYVTKSGQKYDVIQLTGIDTSAATFGANPNLTENYLYTIQAFDEFYNHLTPDGVLSVSFPSVDGLGLKLVATTTEVLYNNGVRDPQEHLVISEITGYIHVFMKHSPFTPAEVETIQSHFNSYVTSFFFPLYHRLFGIPPASFIKSSQVLVIPHQKNTNIYTNFIEARREGRADAFLDSQTQQVKPATDDRPFFFVMDKWGYNAPNLLVLTLSIGILGLVAFVLMIIPLLIQNSRGLLLPGAPFLAGYFLFLGLGFMLVEVNQIQKLSLFLGHPSLAIVFTLCTLLVSSGLGSFASDHWRFSSSSKIRVATILVAVLIGFEALAVGPALSAMTQLSLAMRLTISLIIVAVPGFLMGVPFPTGLGIVKTYSSAFVAWAWVINGTGSIMATLLGVLLAILWGFKAVFILASGLYLCATISFYFYSLFLPSHPN